MIIVLITKGLKFLVVAIDSQETYAFGQVELNKCQLFYKTALSMAFVNKMPVLNGRILLLATHSDNIFFIMFS